MPEPLTAEDLAELREEAETTGEIVDYTGRLVQVFDELRALAEAIWRAQSRNAPTELAAQEAFEEADDRARRVLGR